MVALSAIPAFTTVGGNYYLELGVMVLIFAAIGVLVSASKPADVITVFEQLQTHGKADDAGARQQRRDVDPDFGQDGEADDAEHLGHLLGAGGLADAPAFEAVRHVLGHRPPREQRVLLEHHATVGAGAHDAVAVDEDGARRGRVEPGDDVEQGGLAAPRGADEGHETAGRHVEVDAVDGQHLVLARPEALDQAPHLELGGRGVVGQGDGDRDTGGGDGRDGGHRDQGSPAEPGGRGGPPGGGGVWLLPGPTSRGRPATAAAVRQAALQNRLQSDLPDREVDGGSRPLVRDAELALVLRRRVELRVRSPTCN